MKTTTSWTPGDLALWERIRNHPLDALDDGLSFSRKLAREHGWTAEFTARAIAEYRRFVFLAMTAGHDVVPSETVDQVWHLHLLYTEDYWGEFCPKVLGRPLHHGPGRGRRGETARFRELYAETLASYQLRFGAIDEAVWEPGATRFSDPARWRRVDLRRHLVLPRPSWPLWPGRIRPALAAIALLVPAPAFADAFNPYDLAGGEFLLIYLGLLVLAIGISLALRRPQGPALGSLPALSTYEIAYLAGGGHRVVDTAITDLTRRGVIAWQVEGRRFRIDGDGHGLERPAQVVLEALRKDSSADSLHRRLHDQFDSLGQRLERLGLIADADAARRQRSIATLPFLVLFVFGLIKIGVGISRVKPVAFLVALSIVTLVALAISGFKRVRHTRAGAQAIAQFRDRHSHARIAPRESDVAIGVALAGTAVLSSSAYGFIHTIRRPRDGGGDGGASSSSGCSSSDSGGSDGGSGCSSGCGGCGGGGGD